MSNDNKGIILKIENRRAHIFTTDFRMIVLPASSGMTAGEEVFLDDLKSVRLHRLPTRQVLRAASVLAAILVLFAGIFSYRAILDWLTPTRPVAMVSIDINPSIHLVLDPDYNVYLALPVNEDARLLARSVDVKGLALEPAVRLWVAAAEARGTEDTDHVLLSALYTRDPSISSMLEAIDFDGVTVTVLSEQVSDLQENTIRSEAASNGISIGKMLLWNDLTALGQILSLQDMEEIPLHGLVALCAPIEPSPTPSPTPKPTEPSPTPKPKPSLTPKPELTEPSPTPTLTPTPSPTPAPTLPPKPSATTTTAPKPVSTTKPSEPVVQSQLKVKDNGNGLSLFWTAASDSNSFQYYKVVISQSDSTPIYPDNGSLYVIGNVNQTQCEVNNTAKYYNGDFGFYLVPGNAYYFSITTVYQDGSKGTSNVVKAIYNGPAAAETALSDMTGMRVKQLDANTLAWTKTPSTDGFKYYKVVFSVNNNEPRYPNDGYLFALDAQTTTCTFQAGKPYNGGDVGGTLLSGSTYRVSITYVFDHGSYVSDTIDVLVP